MAFGHMDRGCGDFSDEMRLPRSKLAIIAPSRVCCLWPLLSGIDSSLQSFSRVALSSRADFSVPRQHRIDELLY
jgi:hypothetical protein